ncbi:MAG TPA: hypothetical protein VJ903_04860 [Clostridia bacterium]|nr:hypothetical protein [Clostridia bacterium]
MKKSLVKIIIFCLLSALVALTVAACEFNEGEENQAKFYINDNEYNQQLKNNTTEDQAIEHVQEGITNLREYLNETSIATTGYYMGVEFNINTLNPKTLEGGNFKLKVQSHLYTYPYEEGTPVTKFLDEETGKYYETQNDEATLTEVKSIFKYYEKTNGTYYDEQNEKRTRVLTKAEDIHNEVIKKSKIIIEWYDGVTNQMLIGMYYDGINNNAEDPGNIMYLNLQGSKRYFLDFGDTVLYRQLIRLLTSLSVEKLLVSLNGQDDAGTGIIGDFLRLAVEDNYKVVLNDPITSTLFYNLAGTALASKITDFYQGIFRPFRNKIDPLTKKYVGFKFSTVANAVTNTINSDMQFFTQLNPEGTKDIVTGAYITFDGTATDRGGELYDYVSDISFEYGAYPPEDMKLDKDYYKLFENGRYEFVGNLYIPMLNSNYDALIRTDMNRFDNSTNNVYMSFRDIANGELMMGLYYKNELTYLDISGLEYLYGAIALEELGFPKVYDDSLNLAEALASFKTIIDDMIISIVDSILSPDQSDKENSLLDYLMEYNMSSTEKDPKDIFSKNTVTLTVEMKLIKEVLKQTGNGTYTTRQIINIIDSFSPYSMDQIATILGIASAEIMLDKTYFTFTLNVDTNEITIKMFTDVGVEIGEPSVMIFQLDVIPTHFGEYVDIAEVNFDGFNELQEILTYSATMDGNFMFSTAEVVDLSKLLGATIGDSSGKNTVYQLAQDAGISFNLQYDQYVLDQEIDGFLHRGGRSSFNLQVWITGYESKILIRLASDDVAFNNEVYNRLPESEEELGYIWVDIQCVYEKDGKTRRIPKVKIREDVFMASMQAYMNNTSIKDDAADLGESDFNLSITTILFALMEDSYVVAQPEKIEITTSNETVQNLFRVKSLIGNIKTDAGFTTRVEGLANIKKDYALYEVGQFYDMVFYSPYHEDAILQDTIPTHFYNDYHDEYNPFKHVFRLCDNNALQVYYEGLYRENGFYYNEQRYTYKTEIIDGMETEIRIPMREQLASGIVKITREYIENDTNSFFNNQGPENQDINKVMFAYEKLAGLVYVNDSGDFCYLTHEGEELKIEDRYVIKEDGVAYIKWQGIRDRIYFDGSDAESLQTYYFFNDDLALKMEGDNVYIEAEESSNRNYLFDYDPESIRITNEEKTQYAPRIEGTFMGEVRRYYLEITSRISEEICIVTGLNNTKFYNVDDEFNIVEYFNDDGVKIGEELIPIPLYVMEPAEPIAETVSTIVDTPKTSVTTISHAALWGIDWDKVTLRGEMVITNVTIAPKTMGEATYPIRIIVTNREIIPLGTTDLYAFDSEIKVEEVPIIDSIEIDPYDYIIAKYEFFMDTNNFNPTQYSSAELPQRIKDTETAFNIEYFKSYVFDIDFNAANSVLREKGVQEEYIITSYTNKLTENTMAYYEWKLDQFAGSNENVEKNINPDGGVVYMHTYFEGQLIALRVAVGRRTFDRILFTEIDTFEPTDVDGTEINGHYMANYYDTNSFVVPTQPIFVFTDETGVEYKKVFDFDYVDDLDQNGNYIIKKYGIDWSDKNITNIGSMGSYFYEHVLLNTEPVNFVTEYGNYYTRTGAGTTQDPYTYTALTEAVAFEVNKYYEVGDLVNRPFYISNVERDQNGQIISEKTPTKTSNNSDLDTSSLNLRYSLCLYKYENERKVAIPMISGTDTDYWFSDIQLRVKVECPQLDVDNIGVSEYDEVNDVEFTPSAIGIGSTQVGYYQIDPLNNGSRKLPSKIVIYFRDEFGNRMSSHTFTGMEWKNFDINNEVIVYDTETQAYYFNLSTERPMTTQVVARVGSVISGFQDITLCIKVLSKDPQKVEFYTSNNTTEQNKYKDIEEIGVDMSDVIIVNSESNEATLYNDKSYVSYVYYVDTFGNFELPAFLVATFGIGDNQRTQLYETDWQLVVGNNAPVYRPDSIVNLVTTIGDGEITINIYLAVIVKNYTINRIDLNSTLQNYYVKVGDNINFRFETLLSLYQRDILSQNKLGFYYIDEQTTDESYIVVSTGSEYDGSVEIGKIGLYLRNGDVFELQNQIYPYDFINELYSKMNIIFAPEEIVNYWQYPFEYDDIYVRMHDGTDSSINRKLSDVANIKYVFDNSRQKDTVTVEYSIFEGRDFYLQLAQGDTLKLYADMNMIEEIAITVSLQELTNAIIFREMTKEIVTNEIVSVEKDENEQVFTNEVMLIDSYGYAREVYTFYDEDNRAITFDYITLRDDNDEEYRLSYQELIYRLNYYRKHLIEGRTPDMIGGKITTITDMQGIFNINDVVISQTVLFEESTNYKINIGTGKNSYDLTLRIIFNGGLNAGFTTDDITVFAYNSNGYSQYGELGYVLGNEIVASVETTKQDITFGSVIYEYGYPDTEKLVYWYVEESGYPEIVKGSMITVIPQQVVYANSDETITLSTLTVEGFRIRRTFRFVGIENNIGTYNSIGSELKIENGVIYIKDIYNYYPLTGYFATGSRLPSTIEIITEEQVLRVSDIVWKTTSTWNDGTSGKLYDMTYFGTYNSTMGYNSNDRIAKADILGWSMTEDGETVQMNTVELQLYINIDSAEVISLPWSQKNPKLDTTTLRENGENVFAVDVDAYNDARSSAISGQHLVLPTSIVVEYTSGLTHTFNDVVYKFRNEPITRIPYSLQGINTQSLAVTLGLPLEYFNRQYINLQVDLGLGQQITIRFRFYDKTIENIVAVVDFDDQDIRNKILSSMSSLASKAQGKVFEKFNITRIETNLENLILQARQIRETMNIPSVSEISLNANDATIIRALLQGAFASITNYGVEIPPQGEPYPIDYCWDYAYLVMEDYINTPSNLSPYITNIQRYRSSNTKIAEYIDAFYNDMAIRCYETIIYNYVEEELLKVLVTETENIGATQLNSAIYYKNIFEAYIDVEGIIKGIYKANELYDCQVYSESQRSEAIFELFATKIQEAEQKARKDTNNNAEMSDIIDEIFIAQIGLSEGYGEYLPITGYTVGDFINNSLAETKVAMREIINGMISACMDFSLDIGGEPTLSDAMKEIINLSIRQTYASTVSLNTSISAIRSNITTGIANTTAIQTLFTRAIASYTSRIYMETKIVGEIRRVQEEGIRSDSYYIIDPYGDYLYVPTKFIADFNEENGGFSYIFSATWSNDTISNNVNSKGNAKSDEYSYIEMWLKLYDKYKEYPISKERLDEVLANVTPSETWAEIKENNTEIYGILLNIQQTLINTFANYNIFEEATTIDEKSLILYTYYRAGQNLYNRAKNEAFNINTSWGMNSAEILREFEEYKYTTLTSSLFLTTTMETQQLKLVVKVLNQTIDVGDIQIKDEEGNVFEEFVIENPFTQTKEDIPSIVTINGTDYPVVWKNVTIRPTGNLSANDKTIYGNIKNSSGQQVSMTLTVNKWAYTGMRYLSGTNPDGSDKFTYMNSDGYLNFYFSAYQEYSASDYYQVVFNVYDSPSTNSTATFVNFYPQDSRLLINTTSDADMAEVKERKDYVIYWDSNVKASVINNASSTISAEGNVFLGNATVGEFNLTGLADTTVTGVVTKGKYAYEEMVINKIQLIDIDSGTYYNDVAPYLMAMSGEVALVTDPTMHLPMSGVIMINDGLVDYEHSDIKVRLIWNSSYELAINKLEGFIRYAYKEDVATNEVTAKAKNILMNFDRTETEQAQLIKDATAYIRYRDGCTHLGTECDSCQAGAYKLLCINEKYDYTGLESYLTGGINGKHTVTVVVQVGKSMALYTTTMKVRMVFGDFTSHGNYYLTNPNISENDPTNYTRYNSVPEGNLPTTVYVAVRKNYWNEALAKNSYVAEGTISPYNTTDTYIYKLLDMFNESKVPGDSDVSFIKVTDIVYGDVSFGQVSSTSFKIDQVTYNSNLISFIVG